MCDSPTLSRTTRRTCRADRRCNECRRPILAGQAYDDGTTLFDGSWQRHSLCLHCAHAWRVLSRAIDDCATLGELWSTAVEVEAFTRLPVPATVEEAALLGGALGRLYGAAHDAADVDYLARRSRYEELTITRPHLSPLSLLISSYASLRRGWRSSAVHASLQAETTS